MVFSKYSTRARASSLALALYLWGSVAIAGPQAQRGFEASVSRVRVDVIVSDASGRFVDDLTADDFVVREDGRAQSILGFELVDAGTNTTSVPMEPTIVRSEVRSELLTRQQIATDRSAIVYLLDLPGLDWRSKSRFLSAWSASMQTGRSLAVPHAVYLIEQLGELRELTGLTMDSTRIREAIDEAVRTPLVRRAFQEQLAGSSGGLRASDAEELARSRDSLERLIQFTGALGGRQGRTALVWVTSELQSMQAGPFGALAVALAADRGSAPSLSTFAYAMPDPRIQELEEALYMAANSANVSIYAVDPMPQFEWRSIASSASVDSRMARLLNDPAVQGSLEGLRDALRAASAETGGRAFIGATELETAIRAIEQDTSRYYLLHYATPTPVGDGEYHEITVEVLRRDVEVRARPGYIDTPEETRNDHTLNAALVLPGTASAIPVTIRPAFRWSPDGAPVMQTVIATTTDFDEGPPTRFSLPAEIRGVALDDRGEEAAMMRQWLLPRAAQPRATAPDPPFAHVHEWNLESGEYEIRIALLEESSGRVGATRVTVDVPQDTGAWQTSDLFLFAYAGERTRPMASDVLVEGESLAVQVEVARGRAPVVSGVILADDATTLVAELPPLAMERDDAGIHRGLLRATGFDPGEYVLQVNVIDADAGEHRILRRSFSVADR